MVLLSNPTHSSCYSTMGWLRLVGSLILYVSFAEHSLFYRTLLQKRPIIRRSLQIEATPCFDILVDQIVLLCPLTLCGPWLICVPKTYCYLICNTTRSYYYSNSLLVALVPPSHICIATMYCYSVCNTIKSYCYSNSLFVGHDSFLWFHHPFVFLRCIAILYVIHYM